MLPITAAFRQCIIKGSHLQRPSDVIWASTFKELHLLTIERYTRLYVSYFLARLVQLEML